MANSCAKNQVIFIGTCPRETKALQRSLKALKKELLSYKETLETSTLTIERKLEIINSRIQIFKRSDNYILCREYSECISKVKFTYLLANISTYISTRSKITDIDLGFVSRLIADCTARVNEELT